MKQQRRNASTSSTNISGTKNARINVRRRRWRAGSWLCYYYYCTPVVLSLSSAAALLLLSLLSLQIDSSHAFAAYLISKSNCWTELSTDEVIMNHPVVAATDSDDPNMQIQVVDTDEQTGPFIVVNPQRIAVPHFPVTVPLRVVSTSTNRKIDPDYQWAMDVRDPQVASDTPPVSSSSSSSTFVDGGCPGQNRVAGASAKEFVQVIVTRPGTTVVAAWATTHEAVRLTPELEFVLIGDTPMEVQPNPGEEEAAAAVERGNVETGPEDPIVDVEVEATKNEERGNPETGPDDQTSEMEKVEDSDGGEESIKNQPDNDPQKKIDELMRNSVDGLQAQIERRKKEVAREHEKLSPEEIEQRRQNNAAKKFAKRDRNSDADHENTKHKHLLHYEIGFDVHERLSVGSYVQGAFMLILGTAGMVQFCLWASRRGSKGRLDL